MEDLGKAASYQKTGLLLVVEGCVEETAEKVALSMAKGLDARLILVYITEYNLIHYGQVDQLAPETSKEEFISHVRENYQKDMKRALAPLIEKTKAMGIDSEMVLVESDPVKEISQLALSRQADYIVLQRRKKKEGSSFLGRFKKQFKGEDLSESLPEKGPWTVILCL